MKSKLKKIVYSLIMGVLVFTILEAIGFLGMKFYSEENDFFGNKNYFKIRAMLMGDTASSMLPRYLSAPNVGYIPYPNYHNGSQLQHNSAGFRGEKVELASTGKFRILCMGGSTTYGSGVSSPDMTYPAQLKNRAEAFLKDSLDSSYMNGVEVINAGLEAGTSADELKQYLLKYKYYYPDVVILHSGINDALLMSMGGSPQLDYSHGQRLLFHLEPLSQPARFLMRSYFFSFFSIRLFYCQFSHMQNLQPMDDQHFANWTEIDTSFVWRDKKYSPFYNNSKELYTAVKSNGATLLILENSLNPYSEIVKKNPQYAYWAEQNNSISKNLAFELGATYIPFTYASVKDKKSWLDDCHLDEAGEKDKALLVWPFVKKALLENYIH